MRIIAIILSALALSASAASMLLLLQAKKRTDQRFSSVINYANRFEEYGERIKKLESGVCPDYEKASEAAKAVNDFSAGITAILGFDPIASAKKSRQKDGEG